MRNDFIFRFPTRVASLFACPRSRRGHLDTVLTQYGWPNLPIGPDRRDALSYLGPELPLKVGRASRLPSFKNSIKMYS
jgi:hypothetical protein